MNPYYAWLKGDEFFEPMYTENEAYVWQNCTVYTNAVLEGKGATQFDTYYRTALTAIFAVSFTGLSFVALTINGDSRLKAHP